MLDARLDSSTRLRLLALPFEPTDRLELRRQKLIENASLPPTKRNLYEKRGALVLRGIDQETPL